MIEDEIAAIREEQRKANKAFEARIAALVQPMRDELLNARIQVKDLEDELERCDKLLADESAKR